MADITRKITARHPGKCSVCREPIEPGDMIARKERKGGGWAGRWNHARCETTMLRSGTTIPGSQGVPLLVWFNALGERVGDNAETVLGGIATYAPEGTARMRAREGAVTVGLADDLDSIPF